jgi:hypothetical protein
MQSPVSFFRLIGLGAVFAAVPLSVCAQDDTDSDWNHFGLNFRSGINIEAKFSSPAPSSFSLPPGPGAGAGLNHTYNDGFVNVDSSGNLGGQTWNWGYQHSSQVSDVEGVPTYLLMHATGAEGGGANGSATDNPNLGFDFSYTRDLAHLSWGQVGIKIAFGYTHVDIDDNNPVSANLETITDKYALDGVVPPQAPYSGSSGGPGPVIGSEPVSRSASTASALIAGSHDVDASLFDLRLGPSVNIPLCKRLSFQAGAGLAVGLVDSDFTFTETSPATASGSDSRTACVLGAYGEAGLAYRIAHSTSLFAGAQYEYLGNFNQSADGSTAQLKLGQTVYLEFGLQFHF